MALTPSFAGRFLKEYRKSHNLSQEQLADELHIEPRTLRAYENGERQLNNVNELRRIADTLGVEPERLGVAKSTDVPRSPEQIEEIIKRAWLLVDEARLYEALTITKRLIPDLQAQIITEDPQLLTSLARAHHVAGCIVSDARRANKSHDAILHYQQMESIARALNNHTLLNIALTYQGDMHRRLGDLVQAITYLEAARDTTPQADGAARGNGLQLLARAYLRKGESGLADFERAMAEAEALAQTFDPKTSSTQGHYSLGTVYEEYGRSYTDLGQMQKAMDYLDLAQANLPSTKLWQLLVMISRATVLIKDGEFQSGVQLAIEAANQSRTAGIERYVERICNIQQYLNDQEDYHLRKQQEIRKVGLSLREAIYKGNKEI